MRIDDKQLESEDLAREEAKQRQPHMEAVDDLELRQLASEEVIDADREHAGQVLAAMSAILEKESITVSSLGLPDRERLALESLQAAVGGRDRNMGLFVFASDRRDMLEQALAILQPNLTDLDPAKLSEFHGKYHDLVVRIGDLRASLGDLEDAQDELLDVGLELPDLTKEGSDTDDTDLKDLPSTLSTGPARPEPVKPTTALEGPEIVQERPPSTLYDEAPKR